MIEVFQILSLILAVAWVIMIAEVIAMLRLVWSWGWIVLAVFFALLGLGAVLNFLTLPSVILQTQMNGCIPAKLTGLQWFGVVRLFIATGTGIVGLEILRRNLREVKTKLDILGRAQSKRRETNA